MAVEQSSEVRLAQPAIDVSADLDADDVRNERGSPEPPRQVDLTEATLTEPLFDLVLDLVSGLPITCPIESRRSPRSTAERGAVAVRVMAAENRVGMMTGSTCAQHSLPLDGSPQAGRYRRHPCCVEYLIRAGCVVARIEEVPMAKAKSVPDGYHTLTPQLMLDNAPQTIDWYKKAFGVEEVSRFLGPDGKIMHAELKVGDSRFMVGEVMKDQKGPRALGGSPASLWLYVDNSDALFNKAVGAGAKVHMAMADQFWGDRAGAVIDPAGYVWWVATHTEDMSHAEMQRRGEEFFKQPV